MARLQLQGATFAYEGRAPLFSVDSLVLDPAVIGLFGENGAGKSTLLKLLGDELAPTSGRIVRVPDDAKLVSVSQISTVTDAVRALARWEQPDAGLWLSRFAIDPALVDRFDTASAGERRRLVLAAAFAEEPDVLLLDEPESHVDALVQACLRDALADFRGLCVIVSHDAQLLDAVTTRTLWLEEGSIFDVPGNYALAKLERERRLDRKRTNRAALVAERDHRRKELADARRARDSATANRHPKPKNVHDHDAREFGKKVLAEWSEKSIGKRIGVKRGAVDRLDAQIEEAAFEDDHERKIRFPYRRPKERRLASVVLPELRAGSTLVGRNVSFVIDRETRARVSGPNGAGKSTLLRAIHAECKDHVYLPQELSAEDVRA
ncbi:MAG TPA: ATP-binding cassette domain-containing protein, partial [Polyangiaceae bacterium]